MAIIRLLVSDAIMSAMASQITSLTSVYSIVYSGADQRKHQSSTSPAFVRGIHRSPVNSPHKGPVTRKMFPFDDVIMMNQNMMVGYLHWHPWMICPSEPPTNCSLRSSHSGNIFIRSAEISLSLVSSFIAAIVPRLPLGWRRMGRCGY